MAIFGVLGFGLTTTALLITFAKYFVRNWFPYFMVSLVLFEIGMFSMTKGKTIQPERPPTRSEKSEEGRTNRAPPASPGGNKNSPSPKNTEKAGGQSAATSKQDKAAKKAQAKAAVAAAK